ncbi:hypothetical protein PCASD_12228 [Puccinia coronata f. sp. avenae]|uniref:Uncharacterized protein n=1 Tax=Puccinia coronata f. sp. avenae TaxID=200324 RepID=A0A2N5TAT6_9BASI|nr:hypothetical protein PCASD_12228 [Puccinia coronata f. sp. avenae]
MRVFLVSLFMGAIWICEALYSPRDLPEFSQNYERVDDGSELTQDGLINYASQFSSPHHASSTTTLYTSNSLDQVDSSARRIPKNPGFNPFGHDIPATDRLRASMNVGASSTRGTSPSFPYHHPVGPEIHGFPVHEDSESSFWKNILESDKAGTAWQHLLSSTDLTSSSLEPHIPPTGLSKRGTSFGLPIFWFTRQDLPEAGKTTQHPQSSLFQFQLFLASLGEEEPVVVDDDAKLYELCQSYDSIAAPTEENISRVCERTGYFINNRRIWLRYWEAHTGIKLDVYLKNIKYEAFKGIFPLFLFYIEAITMILPKIKMEDLKDRCKWFAKDAPPKGWKSIPNNSATC